MLGTNCLHKQTLTRIKLSQPLLVSHPTQIGGQEKQNHFLSSCFVTPKMVLHNVWNSLDALACGLFPPCRHPTGRHDLGHSDNLALPEYSASRMHLGSAHALMQ